MLLDVVPLLQLYEYGDVAPDTVTEADPSGCPQCASVWSVVTEKALGSLITKLTTLLQPFASVTVTS